MKRTVKIVASVSLLVLISTALSGTVTFLKDVTQLWDVSVYNKATIPIFVKDKIYYPQNVVRSKFVIINPGSRYRSSWVTGPWIPVLIPALGRQITIKGKCRGSVGSTNKIKIGNTTKATYPTPSSGPSGTYTIINPERCKLEVADPINNKQGIDPYAAF